MAKGMQARQCQGNLLRQPALPQQMDHQGASDAGGSRSMCEYPAQSTLPCRPATACHIPPWGEATPTSTAPHNVMPKSHNLWSQLHDNTHKYGQMPKASARLLHPPQRNWKGLTAYLFQNLWQKMLFFPNSCFALGETGLVPPGGRATILKRNQSW